MKLRKVFTKRIQSLKEDSPTEECSKSVQSFRDIIPQDNRLDLNSATEKQLHTLPGLNKETALAIVDHRKKLNELGREFHGFQDLILVNGITCETLEILRPEVKVVTTSEKRLKGYKVIPKPIIPNGRVVRIGFWRLGDSFTQDFVENLGVTEVIASFLLRHSIDIMVFQGKRLAEFPEKFNQMISELNEPNLPRTSLTQNRGKWTTRLIRIASRQSSHPTPPTSPTESSQTGETKPLLSAGTQVVSDSTSFIIASNLESIAFITDEIYSDLLHFRLCQFDDKMTSNNLEKSISLGFSSRVIPDILISPNLNQSYTTDGLIKTKLEIKSTKKFDTNLEALRNDLIPREWGTNNRVSCIKPEYAEISIDLK